MQNILCIETATEVCSIALEGSDGTLHLTESQDARSHTRSSTLFIKKVLSSAGITINDIDAIAISSGPGSYTGLRVGASIAKGICYTLDLPLIQVSTLESIASSTRKAYPGSDKLHIPMIDARRMEVYTASYDAGGEQKGTLEAKILDETSFQDQLVGYEKLVFSGNGSAKFAEIIDNPDFIFSDAVCSASWMVALAREKYERQEYIDASYYKPEYLKAPNITRSKKKLF